MKKVLWMAVVGLGIGLVSCNKDGVTPNSDSLVTDGSARAGASAATDLLPGPQQPPTPIEISALPATITSAISASYAGATIERAGKDKDGNYVVLILVNNQPKGLLFSASGVFQKELLPPPHPGGPGSGTATGQGPRPGPPGSATATGPGSATGMGPGQGPRPGPPSSGTATGTGQGQPGGPPSLTKVEVSALPSAVKEYVTSKYAGAEIKEAGKDKDGNYVVLIVQNNKPKGLLFNSAGVFQKELPPPPGQPGK